MKLTLDTNCIIALENMEPGSLDLKRLIDLADGIKLKVAILGITASENLTTSMTEKHFRLFEARLESLGLDRLDILLPFGTCDLTFWDKCVWASDHDVELHKRIWKAIFPSKPDAWPDFANRENVNLHDFSTRAFRKWVNAFCDVQIAWATVAYGYDGLITLNSDDFQKKKSSLRALGLKEILTPTEALSMLELR